MDNQKNYVANDIVTIESDIEYYLELPHLVVGSISTFLATKRILSDDNKIIQKEIMYNQCFVKQLEEAIQNSCDEFTRTHGDFANRIDITFKDKRFTVRDNGRGMDMDSYVSAATNFKTGSNFTWRKEGEEKVNHNIGAHGIGSKIIALFSTDYKMTNVKGEDRGILICKNNMSEINHKEDKAPASAKQGVLIEWLPDYERMGLLDEHLPDLIAHIRALLVNIAISFPKITFTFNGLTIKVNSFSDYLKFIHPNCTILEDTEKVQYAVFPSDEYQFIHLANSIDISKGGTALTYIANNTVTKFQERLKKGYSKITTTAVKNKLGVVLILNKMDNLKFGAGQAKEEIKNTVMELGIPTLPYAEYAEKLFKNNHIKEPIIEFYRVQQEFEQRQKLNSMKKTTFKRTEGFYPATQEKKYLYLSEGLSAQSLLMNLSVGITRKDCSFYSLTGKPLNVINASVQQIASNKVMKDLVNIFQCEYNKDISTFSHENVVLASDADADGATISAILLCLFYRFYPEMIKQRRVKKLYLPLMTAINPKTNEIEFFFKDFTEYSEWLKTHDETKFKIKYYKGLASWVSKDVEKLFKTHGIEKFLGDFIWDDETDEVIKNWMHKDCVEFRKEALTADDAILDIGIA